MTFLCGRGGIYALGAVIANHCGDHHKRSFYLAEFTEVHSFYFIIEHTEDFDVYICSSYVLL